MSLSTETHACEGLSAGSLQAFCSMGMYTAAAIICQLPSIRGISERLSSFRGKLYRLVHRKVSLYRGVLYSECPLSEVPLYTLMVTSLSALLGMFLETVM